MLEKILEVKERRGKRGGGRGEGGQAGRRRDAFTPSVIHTGEHRQLQILSFVHWSVEGKDAFSCIRGGGVCLAAAEDGK